MTMQPLYARLQSLRVTLGVDDGELTIKAPPGALDQDTLGLLRQHKPALIAALAAGQAPAALLHPAAAATIAITPALLPLVALTQDEIDLIVDSVPDGAANIQDIYPLAPLQEGILFHHLLGGEGDAYIIRSSFAFDGRQRLDAFLDALQRVVARHDILRSSMRWDGLSTPVQVVQRRAPLPVHTLTAEAGGDALAQLQRHTDPRRLRMDLQRAPLIAAYVMADPQAGEWLLTLLNHHLVSDHLTLEFIIAEVQALLEGRGDSLPAPLPYRNFIAQAGAVPAAAHEEYFRRRLADIDEPTAPFGLLDVQHDGQRIGEARLRLDPALALRVREGARRHGVTAAVLFHTAWAQVLAQCCGRDDVVFGTVLSGRLQGADGAGQVLGMFINTLPLRISLGARPIGQVVRDSYRDLGELLVHEQASLALAQRCSGVAAPQPLFTTLLNYRHSQGGAAGQDAGRAWQGMRAIAAEERSNYPVTVSVDDFGDGFALTALCAAGIDPQRMAGYLLTALEALSAALAQQPDQPAHALSILPPAERRRLLEDFNDSAADYPREQLIHQLFEANAAARPDATALVFEDRRLAYGELNRRANRLARRLLALGVRPGQRVALCAGRGLEMVVGLLAILKAGAAYVPLDPAYPADRLAYMLADSAPVALLTEAHRRDSLPAGAPPLLLLDADPGDGDGDGDDLNPDPAALGLHAGHLAYIIYTSGSTGRPKGVAVQHRPVINLFDWVNRRFGVGPGDTLLLTTSLCFDLSVYDIFGLLAAGGTVHIASSDDIADPRRLLRLIDDAAITFWDSAPAVFAQLLPLLAERAGQPPNQTLRLAFFSGDWIPLELPPRLRRAYARCEVISLGGATEATVWSNFHPVGEPDPAWVSIPYGRPIQNARYHVLDRHLQPCPLGVPGDLYIAGECLSAGYFGQPALTAERYPRDPFTAAADARMYRTGDRARYWDDGTLEFLGRSDFQVKIRGFRIELGEIEARLAACDGVREALVIAREDSPGDKRLVAYLTAQAGAAPQAAALRAQLALTLAEYMLPSAFVTLERFPLTSNGKLDRRALPAPDHSAVATRAYEAPEGAVEVALAGLWSELLGLTRVGRHDQFFELGGHSLLAVRLVSRLRQQLGVELPLRALFEQPTLAGLAAAVALAGRASGGAIAGADRGQPLPLSWAQQRLWFLARLDPAGSMAYHMPAALRLRGALERAVLQATLDRVVARHESLRTSFADGADGPVQRIGAADSGFALAWRDLRGLGGQEQEAAVARIGADEACQPFDLAAGPLLRGQLLCLADDDHLLLLTQHHIVTDAWSIGVLVREVSALYTAFHQGLADPLPPLAIQYADYAAWQRRWLGTAALQAQTAFWRAHLDGAPALLELPLDRPRPALQSHAGASVPLAIPAPLAAGLRALAVRHGATLFMTLLTGWAALLARLSGQDDIVVGTPVAHRGRAELEGLIGFFVNTLALRVRLDQQSSADTLLARVKADTLAAYEHQDLPFEQLVEALRPPRSMRHSPVFQTMLSLDNTAGGGALALPGLTLAPHATPRTTSHFELSLALADDGATIAGSLDYASDLFDHATVERYAGYLLQLLAAMVAAPARPLADLPLLDAAQRRQLLAGFNASATAATPASALLQQQFEARAAARPDAPALVRGDQRLSYGELNRRANRLAHRLLAHGVRPDQRVAVCTDDGVALVTAMLAILKAGGAYVPLDPSYPDQRIAHMLADSAPVLLLADAAQRRRLPTPGPAVLALEAAQGLPPEGQGEADDERNPDPAQLGLTARHLAYVIYTSGSTGNPKGVMLEHAGLANFGASHYRLFDITPDSRLLQFAAFGFDASISEIAMTLCAGASLYLREQAAYSAASLGLALRRHAISHLILAPTVVEALLAAADPGPLTLIVVGEACPPALARAWSSRLRLFNAYGPTESTICATVYRCAPHFQLQQVPIGRPIPHTPVYILDARGQPVPPGVIGELCIGGAGVARGYLHQPALSAQHFVADPFGADPGARLYRSGDLGRWLADGNIEYLGRNDGQVKLRGLRIELGEIETRLAACAGVRAALVLARSDRPGEPRLVAYLLAQPDATPDPAALRAQLGAELPSYMLPSAFVTLAEFPLGPNGKLDRNALPAPDSEALPARHYSAPRGEVETALAALWQELLALRQVGRDAHFFELGGHSLMAAQLLVRVRDAFGVTLALRQVFEQPSLAAMAAAITSLQYATYLGEDLDTMRDSLDGLSKEELLAMLAKDAP
ncbi:non-ribosomal peptide synthetase [Duganella violaceipulchra]|uniref:Amino acid adenylation domain-containing protein n=1 Tax=Duganella violaceipulchra TaxID=2849652 RepID=A0AA41HJS2_9BURK|nr:non-ribosomal peptide synthetase [Duganella violaceicalia]MBV6325446.1 amino acid adenylation domain-containing protein [Duganella violaceicalia]MCP2012535.1 amino acid adenylation domain-containing protein [Duganella violaceicalia]